MNSSAGRAINNVLIYCRVSTEEQAEKFSISAQGKLLQELAERHEWKVVEVIKDEGFSGSLVEERPGFNRILGLISSRAIDAVLVTDIDRLSRPENLKDLGRIQEAFITAGARIVTLSGIVDLADATQWVMSSFESLRAASPARNARRGRAAHRRRCSRRLPGRAHGEHPGD